MMPTASSVVADLIDLAVGRAQRTFAAARLWSGEGTGFVVEPSERVRSRHYLRLLVADRPGVLADVTRILADEGISASVIDMHTVKPLDTDLILEEARRTGHVLVAEEHQIWGGLGSAVATFLAKKHPCKMGFVAIQDTFAESGKGDELLEKYGLTYPHIIKAAKRILGK